MISEQSIASSLIVISNRLPFILRRGEEDGSLNREPSAGGLVTAVAPLLEKCGGYWVGWPGIDMTEDDVVPEAEPDEGSSGGIKSEQVIAVTLDAQAHDLYYNGCCNATLWPLFHSMPDRAIFREDYWTSYIEVNKMFAQKTLIAIRRKIDSTENASVPIVWIHDYHLMLAAGDIRQACIREGLNCKLAFFLHIPFPSWDIIKIFPWYSNIIQGILACDLVGFHIKDYCLNFLDCCKRGLGCRIDRKSMLVEDSGRAVPVRAMPIGIPFARFRDMALAAPPCTFDTDVKVILGVDRLDYTKGLPMRLKAFEHLLETYPELCESIMLLQVAVPSRTDVKEYRDLKEEMDKLVGQINGRFSTPNWSPIRYICGYVAQNELAAFYRDADVGLVTPLRDGMNLVAKEFVACRINKPGVLILSPFAGAGDEMIEALMVNPYEVTNVSTTLYRALHMPDDERQLRMNALKNREAESDVDHWMKMFFDNMKDIMKEEDDDTMKASSFRMQPVSIDDFDVLLGPYVSDGRVICLMLDYDGTLSPIASHPDLAVIPPATKKLLEELNKNPNVRITIISGRDVNNVKNMVGIEDITYAGSHGLNIILPDGSTFNYPMPENGKNLALELKEKLDAEVCTHGAWVENKGFSLTYHYRRVPNHLQVDLIEKAKEIITESGFQIVLAHCAVECKQPDISWNKGRACIYILKVAFGVDWTQRIRIIYVGDDVTDEDAFISLKGMASTFRVVSTLMTSTNADFRLPSTESVLALLRWVHRHMDSIQRNEEQNVCGDEID